MSFLLRLAVAGLLAAAGGMKLGDPEAFALAIANYHLLPRQALQPLAYLLPLLELAAAGALFQRPLRGAGWRLSCGLFATFSLAVGLALVRGLDISCGCFGGSSPVSWIHLVGTGGLALVCASQGRQSVGPWREPLVLLLALGSALACLHHAVRADRPLFSAPRNPGYESLLLVSLDDVRKALGQPGQVLLDARSAQAYRQSSLPGALSLPLHRQPDPALETQLRSARRILVFCGNRSCNSSKEQAVFLRTRGFEQAVVFPGGVKEWKEAGLQLSPGGEAGAGAEPTDEAP